MTHPTNKDPMPQSAEAHLESAVRAPASRRSRRFEPSSAPGFTMTLRVFACLWAVWLAFAASILWGKVRDGQPFSLAAITFSLGAFFLLLPPRLLAKNLPVAVMLAVPFPAWLVVTFVREGAANTDWTGMLLLMTGVFLQLWLVFRARRGGRESSEVAALLPRAG